MHLYNKEQAIKRMNQFGQHHRPFVFIINYLQGCILYIEEVAAVDSTELLYNLNGFTNQITSTENNTPSFSAKTNELYPLAAFCRIFLFLSTLV